MKIRTKSHCPISRFLDYFGDKWTLLIVRDVLLAKKLRYRDLLDAPEGIATNILADRLKMLVEQGIVTRESDPENGTQTLYRATKKAEAIMPVLQAMKAWGETHGRRTARSASTTEAKKRLA